jgi:hypothetical protein
VKVESNDTDGAWSSATKRTLRGLLDFQDDGSRAPSPHRDAAVSSIRLETLGLSDLAFLTRCNDSPLERFDDDVVNVFQVGTVYHCDKKLKQQESPRQSMLSLDQAQSSHLNIVESAREVSVPDKQADENEDENIWVKVGSGIAILGAVVAGGVALMNVTKGNDDKDRKRRTRTENTNS